MLLWALPGALLALAVAALLSIGPYALVAAVIAAVVVGRVTHGRGLGGLAVGVGLLGLYLAWVQRRGPGLACTSSPGSQECQEYLDPVPFLVIGIVVIVLGVGLEWWLDRRRFAGKGNAP